MIRTTTPVISLRKHASQPEVVFDGLFVSVRETMDCSTSDGNGLVFGICSRIETSRERAVWKLMTAEEF